MTRHFLPSTLKSSLCSLFFLMVSGILPLFLTSCLKNIETRGYTIEQSNIKDIQPSVSTKEQVLQILGSPTSRSVFGQETWYYISSKTASIAFLNPKIVDQQVIAISFDADSKVKDLHQYSLKDARNVQFAKDVTPTEGRDMSVIQQILGNVGRFNPDGGSPSARISPHNRNIPGY